MTATAYPVMPRPKHGALPDPVQALLDGLHSPRPADATWPVTEAEARADLAAMHAAYPTTRGQRSRGRSTAAHTSPEARALYAAYASALGA